MKTHFFASLIFILSVIFIDVQAQDSFENSPNKSESTKSFYTLSGVELLFNYMPAEIENEAFQQGVRTTYFFNVFGNAHIDFSRFIGLKTGISVRNVGVKTNDEEIHDEKYRKVIRRAYMFGASGAIKIGNLQNFNFVYFGAACEIPFHYRQRNVQKNMKLIRSEWMPNVTERFIPSVFIGYQSPKYINIQARYYLSNFIKPSYNGVYGDFSSFSNTQIFQISLSFQQRESDKNGTIRERILQPLTEI